ncbi:MAG: translation elongation factor-like protein [Candidatus Staskawiczbacteria bacterium RIFOXYD2_FULL_37_9]|uniref:Translation elongation factor-like protein n=1 Tax=Candidatus Staskawiczbacteria bacterium RIFOXYB1_FULL_37_44 TaxID=1802223 RepID=A0A1G2IVJ6_9BACT|nr:MAG: translation elongation factor-like protein [Candidatus Staskawiczbacteria bacterium RIFOXYB1_FULL_37_44]OGZ82819.1 MAG: translation elongation factor-like protein [Candidatus Staskawiczbacteria bacterium RIFOXYC1_FULL_37_52]OGZ88418.1 MAG: translation elongation factor-like protein [Candidatus Staskawiczbacteria bacterium RIFOXYC2_FULL_37_19]OGZ90590.1 MAG: translation elongation factor-like protein [Candidatus Staskawiczbacteria bacterium RIFOXYD1_FULL_37_110]OGZ93183.1 MAG: translatio
MKKDQPRRVKAGKPIGKVTHYFSDIQVAVINLSAPLKQKDVIRIVGGEATDFEQKIGSMQIDRKEIKSAKKGDSIGIKVNEKVREGYKVFKL